jgi:hypothetical protein
LLGHRVVARRAQHGKRPGPVLALELETALIAKLSHGSKDVQFLYNNSALLFVSSACCNNSGTPLFPRASVQVFYAFLRLFFNIIALSMPSLASGRCSTTACCLLIMILVSSELVLGVLDEDAKRAGFSGKRQWLRCTLQRPPTTLRYWSRGMHIYACLAAVCSKLRHF